MGYQSKSSDWTLSVSDDGVGMPKGSQPVKIGLGSSIVEALAKQLHATVLTTDCHPGTCVSIRRDGAANAHGELAAIHGRI